jgi:DNA-binding Xre family transcriptional regulator
VKTRILKVNLKAHLRKTKLSDSALAQQIGIAPQTLAKMLTDQWDYVSRDAIERTADYLDLEVWQVFEFVPVNFWKPIEDRKQCTFLRGSQDPDATEDEFTIPGPDVDATNVVFPSVRRFVANARYIDHERDVAELIDRAMHENCIVIGSPKSNAATEILLSRFFDAQPFDSNQDNRLKIPFGFCWPEVGSLEKESSLTCSGIARKRTKLRPGIAVQGGPFVEADYLAADDFKRWNPEKPARDCGLVFVANNPFGTTLDVKLIVLAGFSGIGTLGAAKALIEDFRYLEPTPKKNFVFGVVQVWYTKDRNDETRTYKRFRWKYRTGTLPINEKEDKKGKPTQTKR